MHILRLNINIDCGMYCYRCGYWLVERSSLGQSAVLVELLLLPSFVKGFYWFKYIFFFYNQWKILKKQKPKWYVKLWSTVDWESVDLTHLVQHSCFGCRSPAAAQFHQYVQVTLVFQSTVLFRPQFNNSICLYLFVCLLQGPQYRASVFRPAVSDLILLQGEQRPDPKVFRPGQRIHAMYRRCKEGESFFKKSRIDRLWKIKDDS